jgi:hypothetical protein
MHYRPSDMTSQDKKIPLEMPMWKTKNRQKQMTIIHWAPKNFNVKIQYFGGIMFGTQNAVSTWQNFKMRIFLISKWGKYKWLKIW